MAIILAVAGVIITPLVEAAKCAFPYIRQKSDFLFDYKRNVETLNSELAELTRKKGVIKDRLDSAERIRSHEPTPEVAKWLENVEKETQTILDWEEGNQKCTMGLCLNWRNRYKFNKEVKQKTSEVRKLIAEVQSFEVLQISTPSLPPSVEHMNISGYVETDSSIYLMQRITDLLESESIKPIGIWGMGGVGKTTFVTKLNNYYESNSIFEKVIFLKISQNPDWKKLHKEIAEKIGLTPVDYEDENMRINMLSKALGKKKLVLFIVDDVWTSFQLHLLGMRDDGSDVNYKLIITTRDLQILDQMGVNEEEQFELRPMSEEDSWKLFQAKADYVANLPAIQPIAIELCHKCGGSPLAICTFATTLRGDKKKISWNAALRALVSSDQSVPSGILMPVYKSIEFSFDRLQSEAVKLCFLYCCSHPFSHVSHPNENYQTFLHNIRIYGISQNLINGRALKDASERVEAFVEELRKSSLLVVDGHENFVTIHDVVQQVGTLIASNKYGFVVKSDQQLDMNDINFNNQPNHASLFHSKIDKLPNTLCCPSLLALDMHGMSFNGLPEIHDEFFAITTKLQYLDISGIGICKIPNSLYDLIHLRTLNMSGLRNLLDISSIGKLECLEVLILDNTGIEELPQDLGSLKRLTMLHLMCTHELRRVAPNIFNQLCSLQELNMKHSFSHWELKNENGVNASLWEIFGLSQLTSLHLDINDPLCLEHDYMCASLSNLEKFRIVVSTSEDSINNDESFARYLCLAKIPLRFGNWISKLFKTCEYLKLSESDVVETLPYQEIKGFDNLTELRISNFRFMKHIIDCHLIATRRENNVFPSLERLVIEDMDNLEYVCNTASVTGVLFSKMTHIQIHNCKKLRILFMGSTDQALPNLTEIQINGCDELEALADVRGPSYFQKIKKIEVRDCGKLETLSTGEAEWENLETICITRCRNLQSISRRSVFPQNLKHLTVEECQKLTTSVSSLIQRSFSRIEKIKVTKCNPGNVEYLLSTNEIDKFGKNDVFENLKVLEVKDFDGKGIFYGLSSQSSLPNLAEVRIEFCNDLTSIWGSSETFASLKPLKTLIIRCCDKLMLREVFLPKGMGDEFALRVEHFVFIGLSQLTTLALLPQASLQYVKKLELSGCENLKYLLPHCHAGIMKCLKTLVLQNCSNLESIILQNDASKCELRGQASNTIREDVVHDNLTCTDHTTSTITISELWIENCSRLDLDNLGLTCTRSGIVLTFKRLPQLETLKVLMQLPNSVVGQRCDTIKVLQCENFTKIFSLEEEYDFENLIIYDCPKLLPFICEEEIVTSPRTQQQDRVEPIKPTFSRSTFRNLNFLFIGDCHNLKNIFSISIAQSLVCLEYIDVVNCEKLREIVACWDLVDSEAYYAVLFPQLKSIHLFWLPNLECFCRGNSTLIWPSLRSICVWESPKLVTTGMGPSSAPNLLNIKGQKEWFENFKEDSSLQFSRLSFLCSPITNSDVHEHCSTFDGNIHSTAYTSKLEKTFESQEGSLVNERPS